MGEADGDTAQWLQQKEAPPVPPVAYDLLALQSLRRMIRAADIFSHRLIKHHKITGPQLLVLHTLLEHDGLTVSGLAKAIYLSPSTVVGILDRLEAQGLVSRMRSTADRRRVLIYGTDAGRELVAAAPSPLQDALHKGFAKLTRQRRKELAEAVAELVTMLEIEDIDAAPLLSTDAKFIT